MNIGSSFIACPKAPELMEPGQGSFNHPARLTKPASVSRILMCDDWLNSSIPQLVLMIFRSVAPISLHSIRPLARPSGFSGNRRNGVDQRQELGHIMSIRRSKRCGEGNSRRIGDHVMLAPWFTAIRRVGTDFCPPSTARTEALSTTARDQSIRSAAWSHDNRTWWSVCQTPASCQSRSRRQQVIPLPQPISRGSISQGIPLRSTKRIPVNAARLSTGGLPPKGYDRGGGKIGSTIAHNSSETMGRAMAKPSLKRQAKTIA